MKTLLNMMEKNKTRHFVLFVLLISFFVVSCRKEAADMHKDPKLTDETLEIFATRVDFSWKIDYPGKFSSQVEISLNEDMSDAVCYGSVDETTGKKFSATADNLKEATKYYYRFVVRNPQSHYELEEKSFVTKADVPKVRTVEVTEVTRTTAKVICEVTGDSGAEVTERGVCWGTSHNPTTSGNHSNEGTGIGSYSIPITGLAVGKTYYVRAYAVNNKGTAYGEELSFVTGDAVKPTVTTAEVVNIDWRTATGGGEVTDDGDATVTERGICWSTDHNPEITDSHASDGTGTGSYTVNMTRLTAGTTYYVRAYAKNQAGVGYGDEVSFSTKAPELPTVTTGNITDISWTTAKCSGNVTSDGGTEVIERGICWSTSHNPEIATSHASGGTGIGSYTVSITGLTAETTYYVRAYARNSLGVSYGEEKHFETPALQKPTVTTARVISITLISAIGGGEVTSDGGTTVTERGIYYGTSPNPSVTGIKLVASSAGTGVFSCTMGNLDSYITYYACAYATNNQGTTYGDEESFVTQLEGAIVSLFSVSSNEQVYFSQGNLQYQASTSTWQFAENQYDCIGDANSNISSSYSGWIDLFGWGTSGWDSGAVFYRPWSVSTTDSDYCPDGSIWNDLTGSYANADWGVYNAITNGGNQVGLWRTLTANEWKYVFETRNTSSGIRYAKACVNNQNGVILLPDDWSASYYSLSSTNNPDVRFTINTISVSQWSTLEQHGAVFLPAAGRRYGNEVSLVDNNGRYWSASSHLSDGAYAVLFNNQFLSLNIYYRRCLGLSVRLVRNAQ